VDENRKCIHLLQILFAYIAPPASLHFLNILPSCCHQAMTRTPLRIQPLCLKHSRDRTAIGSTLGIAVCCRVWRRYVVDRLGVRGCCLFGRGRAIANGNNCRGLVSDMCPTWWCSGRGKGSGVIDMAVRVGDVTWLSLIFTSRATYPGLPVLPSTAVDDSLRRDGLFIYVYPVLNLCRTTQSGRD